MSVWMSERDFRQGGAAAIGVTINVPFLQEIKEDYEFRHLLAETRQKLKATEEPTPRQAAEMLSTLRDELETYFALEEFYGYFQRSAETNPSVCQKAGQLRTEHETLFLQLNGLVEMIEQIVYHECSPKITVRDVADKFDEFCTALSQHEQCEMDLMMRMCNEDIGVGD
jgi:iron-sulfur cluster repair protein YtfE (RIC family)